MGSLIIEHLQIMAEQAKANGDTLGESTLRTAADRLDVAELERCDAARSQENKNYVIRLLRQEAAEAHNDLDLLGITRHGPASDGTGPTTLTLHGRLFELRGMLETAGGLDDFWKETVKKLKNTPAAPVAGTPGEGAGR